VSEREPDELDRALAQMDRPEPPAGLTEAVMRGVADVEAGLSGWRRWRRARRSRQITNFLSRHRVSRDGQHAFQGGVIVRTKILWGVTGLAAMAIVTFFVFGYPPVDRTGTEATINQAQRYQGATLSMKDVSVPDTDVQQFIQSDTFDRLLKDKTAREALIAMFRDEEAAMALARPGIAEIAARPGAVEAMGRPAVQGLFANAAARKSFARPGVAEALAQPSLRPYFEDAAFMEALARPGIADALAAPAVRGYLEEANMKALNNEAALKPFVSQPAVANALSNAAVRLALARPGVAELLAMPAMRTFMSDEAALSVLAWPRLAGVMADAQAGMALANPAVAKGLAHPAITAGLANAAMLNALAQPAMSRALGVAANRAGIAAAFPR
jgi:hypothetical protein